MASRRKFLERISITTIGLPLISSPVSLLAASCESYEAPILKVAIMGLGSYGNRVAEAMKTSTRTKLVGVISGTPSKIEKWKSKYSISDKNCYNYENFDAIKDNPDIDAVYIITTNGLHKDQTL
jgi:predicted dehydrogenase